MGVSIITSSSENSPTVKYPGRVPRPSRRLEQFVAACAHQRRGQQRHGGESKARRAMRRPSSEWCEGRSATKARSMDRRGPHAHAGRTAERRMATLIVTSLRMGRQLRDGDAGTAQPAPAVRAVRSRFGPQSVGGIHSGAQSNNPGTDRSRLHQAAYPSHSHLFSQQDQVLRFTAWACVRIAPES